MLKKYITLTVCLWAGFKGAAQPAIPAINRAQLTIMVVPYTSKGEDILTRIEKDAGYKDAVAAINTALLNLGYKVRDFKEHIDIINQRIQFTQATSQNDRMKKYIEQAPVDLLIEAEIIWSDPPDLPTHRQVRVLLKAVDKYTSDVYANSTTIQSFPREFSGLPQAIDHAFTSDGVTQFRTFLKQLDISYASLLTDGRPMKVKFEVAANRNFDLTKRINTERLSDKIIQAIKQYTYKGQYKVIGETETYMDFVAQVPVIDEKGNSVTPTEYLRYKVDQYLFALGFDMKYSTMGPWINFTLINRN